jgi:hypothetical protein
MKPVDTPYRSQPDTAFWSRSVSRDFDPARLFQGAHPLLRPDDRIVSAGSCFAANIVPHLKAAGFHYVETEFVDAEDDRFFYGRYSAAYGNIYSARQFRQLAERCLGRFRPAEDRWPGEDGIVDPFRPGMPFPAEDDEEFDLVLGGHLGCVREAFEEASVVVFTLGLSEAWCSTADGAVFPSCPGVVAGAFDPARHRFVNFRTSEIAEDMRMAIALWREINPALRFILTVSPVPLAATATDRHVLVANAYSKAALRAAAEEVVATVPDVSYFPAYEIVFGLDANENFEPDRRHVSAAAVSRVIAVLFAHCEMPEAPATPGANAREAALELSRLLVKRECEEGRNDPGGETTGGV